ncbi:amine oxidase [Raphidocelis subcapitata]|uniref:Amine oxidase n=1 Tax=Raphidocelis subcapitata TaxID=307507 RepID=A0A2V0NQB4_9CHLO|nr:amine oxidase [Raphidocelis subcapitata]|eukprot:GBF89848.1 amine oxidase [Raphidocelis subcapitata]
MRSVQGGRGLTRGAGSCGAATGRWRSAPAGRPHTCRAAASGGEAGGLPRGWGPRAPDNEGSAPAAAAEAPSAAATATQPRPQQQRNQKRQQPEPRRRRRVVVVGGGWGGFGAALAAAKAGAEVTLLDASDSPGGLSSAFVSQGGRVVEPGIKGFWRCYSNIDALLTKELRGALGGGSPLTGYTRSGFWTPEGLEVEAPVFGDLPRLPAPLGTFFHTAALFRRLPLADRLTALGLVGPLLEHDADEATYAEYDSTSALTLFRRAGVSRRLYKAFLEPMLLVTLFAPPEQLSSAAALGTLYYFALAHQDDWDVRWCRGPVGDLIMRPFARHLEGLGVKILGGRRAQQVLPAPGGSPLAGAVVAAGPGGAETFEADAVVLAAGVGAAQALVSSSPLLAAAPDLRALSEVRRADVLAARVWLDRKLPLQFPSNVVSGLDEGSGATLFDLSALQDQYAGEPGSVLEFDVYHAEQLLPLDDESLVKRLLTDYLPAALPPSRRADAAGARASDASVLRFRGATTVFSPGSARALPRTASDGVPNVFFAGDCVAQGPGTHGAKGLSQEKAYATGLQAGNAAARLLGLAPAARVLPVQPDEPHVAAAKEAARARVVLSRALRGGGAGGAALAAVARW